MKIQHTSVGLYEIDEHPHRASDSVWRRFDTFVTAAGIRTKDRIFVAGPQDLSEVVIHPYGADPGNARYDSRCPSCYLGTGHSLERHQQFVSLERDQQRWETARQRA